MSRTKKYTKYKKIKKTKKTKNTNHTNIHTKLKLKLNKYKSIIKEKKFKEKKLSIRIITTKYDGYETDLIVYLDIFKKQKQKQNNNIDIDKIDVIYLYTDRRVNINYEPNRHYDINLFLDTILPMNNNNNSKSNKQDYSYFKTIFPASIHMFAPNVNSFTNYKQLQYIDIVLCNTLETLEFINFIKKEKNNNNTYKFATYYTKFTTPIPKKLQIKNVSKSSKSSKLSKSSKPFIFIHAVENYTDTNTASLIYCWLNNNGFLDTSLDTDKNTKPELHILCYGLSYTNLLVEFEALYKTNLLSFRNFTYKSKDILKYENLYIYTNDTQINNIQFNNNNENYIKNYIKNYNELMQIADVAIYPSKKAIFPHYINASRYYNIPIITMDSKPMNELVNMNNMNNGYLLKNKSHYDYKQYRESKYKFCKAYPDINELKKCIIDCINNNSIRNNNVSRSIFDKDKQYFENTMEKIIKVCETRISKTKIINESREALSFNTMNINRDESLYNNLYLEKEDEKHCMYISSRGFLKSCNVHSIEPISSIAELVGYDMSQLYDGCSIYVCNSAIPKFAEKLKEMEHYNMSNIKFTLVSGDADETCPNDLFDSEKDFKSFIENKHIIHWFAQNCIISNHPKITQLPIGLQYHQFGNVNIKSPLQQEKELKSFVHNAKPFWEREVKCYINFILSMGGSKFGYDRIIAYHELSKNLNNHLFVEHKRIDKKETLHNQCKYAFVISPFGNGLDTHRTWEALILGCIPIVRSSGLDSMYDDLPVLIVKEWSDVTPVLLNKTIIEFKEKHKKGKYNYNKLMLKYWMDKINGKLNDNK